MPDRATDPGQPDDDLTTAFGPLLEPEGSAAPDDVEPDDARADAWRSGALPPRAPAFFHDWTVRDTGRALALVAAAVVFLVPAALLLQQRGEQSAAAAQQASSYTPPALPSASTTEHTGPVVAVVGDETAVTAAAGVPAAGRWPALLGKRLDSDVTITRARSGGYTARGTDDLTFVTAAGDVPSDADVVLIVGGSHDAGATRTALTTATTQAVAAATGRAPQAAIAVVGPIIGGGGASSASVRTALAGGAGIAGVRWVDPFAAAWVQPQPAQASGLTAADEKVVATRLAALVKSLTA